MDKDLIKTVVEGCVAYGFYILMSTSKSDRALAQAKMCRAVGNFSRRTGYDLIKFGAYAERKAQECLS